MLTCLLFVGSSRSLFLRDFFDMCWWKDLCQSEKSPDLLKLTPVHWFMLLKSTWGYGSRYGTFSIPCRNTVKNGIIMGYHGINHLQTGDSDFASIHSMDIFFACIPVDASGYCNNIFLFGRSLVVLWLINHLIQYVYIYTIKLNVTSICHTTMIMMLLIMFRIKIQYL